MIDSGAQVFPPAVSLKSNFWSNWSYIAVDHARTARVEREALLTAWAGEPKDTTPMVAETNASLVAIGAVAFAIEVFHADLAPLADRSADIRVARGKQRGYLLDTFRHNLTAANRWQKDLNFVFDLRDDAVHFMGINNPPEMHPAIPTNVAREHITFSVKSAERSVAFLVRVWRDIFAGSVGSPFEAWAKDRQHVLQTFLVYIEALPSQARRRNRRVSVLPSLALSRATLGSRRAPHRHHCEAPETPRTLTTTR